MPSTKVRARAPGGRYDFQPPALSVPLSTFYRLCPRALARGAFLFFLPSLSLSHFRGDLQHFAGETHNRNIISTVAHTAIEVLSIKRLFSMRIGRNVR